MSELNVNISSIRNHYTTHLSKFNNEHTHSLFIRSFILFCTLFETLCLLPIILFHQDLVRFLAHQTQSLLHSRNKLARSKERDKVSEQRQRRKDAAGKRKESREKRREVLAFAVHAASRSADTAPEGKRGTINRSRMLMPTLPYPERFADRKISQGPLSVKRDSASVLGILPRSSRHDMIIIIEHQWSLQFSTRRRDDSKSRVTSFFLFVVYTYTYIFNALYPQSMNNRAFS